MVCEALSERGREGERARAREETESTKAKEDIAGKGEGRREGGRKGERAGGIERGR
jgi:hypothetical protein